MSAYTRLCSGLLFPLHEHLKRHSTVATRRRLEVSQWKSTAEIRDMQAHRLRDFLIDIGAHVPYFRDLFARTGFDPRAVSSVQALAALPLTSKAEIRANHDRLKADDHGALTSYNTGGSSGEPLVFYIGKNRKSHDVAAKWRSTRWWGVDVGDRELVVWGSPIELGAQDRWRALRDKVLRTHLLPAFEMSSANLDRFIAQFRRVRPRMVFGYPSALAHIAQYAEGSNRRLDDVGIQVAFVTSEMLYDEQRATIERVFGCRVANGYGGRDAGFIAHECPSRGMHISAEDIVVELLDSDGRAVADGEPGEVVVTHLATRDFPFVRYRTGDIAVAGGDPCPCGRGLPLLREIRGRTTDFVVASDGTLMHGLALIYVLRQQPGIQAFKITQRSRLATEVKIVAGAGFERQALETIQSGLRARLGSEVEIDLQIVDKIPAEPSGKYRYVVSHAAQPHSTRARQ